MVQRKNALESEPAILAAKQQEFFVEKDNQV
jgi:hypothetical protein